VRYQRTPGSVRGARSNPRSYRDHWRKSGIIARYYDSGRTGALSCIAATISPFDPAAAGDDALWVSSSGLTLSFLVRRQAIRSRRPTNHPAFGRIAFRLAFGGPGTQTQAP
jgi:hypothetical protein